MSYEPAISVSQLSKCYTVYTAPQDRLKQAIVPRLERAVAPMMRLLGKQTGGRTYCRQHWALRDVSFSVEAGETLGVIGRNGAGKSTLLQLICGTLTPTSGHVEVRGRVGALLELGSGFNPEFTGRENVYLNATVLGLGPDEIDAKLEDILAFADIGEYVDQPIKTYSSGMAMRLAFAVIAHVNADILIIDEALAVGDAYFQQKCMRWLRRFRETGSVLFCGHDVGAMINLCNRAVWLERGSVEAYGDAKNVCEAYSASIHAQAAGITDTSPRLKTVPSHPEEPARRPKRNRPLAGGVFEFNENSASFGSGDATILHAAMMAADGSDLAWINGGEEVEVRARIRANRQIDNPIAGFIVKDRLGQPIIGDNTYLSYASEGLSLNSGDEVEARFVFGLPFLRSGEYSVTIAIASGTPLEHVQHHWLHDAFVFVVHSPYANGVMVAVPVTSTLDVKARQLSE